MNLAARVFEVRDNTEIRSNLEVRSGIAAGEKKQ